MSGRATTQFVALSNRVNAIEKVLRTQGLLREANLIREVQEAEKEKLMLTLAQQLDCIRQQQDTSGQEALYQRSATQLQTVVETINSKMRQLAPVSDGADAADY